MAELPVKPVLELNRGIEVEEAMDVEKSASGADRRDDNVKHVAFESPDIVSVTGGEEAKEKEPEAPEEKPQEEVESNLLELRKMMGLETKADKEASENAPEEPEQEQEPEPEQESEPEPEVEEASEEDRPRKRLRKKDPAPSMEDMAKLAGQAAAEALKERDKAGDVVPETSESSDLDDDDRVTYDIFKQMEKSNPDKYKGAKERFVDFVEASKAYQRQWLSENPGEEFDPDSSEHSDFYSENEPKYSKADFKKAEKRVEMADVISEVESKYQERIDELEHKISRKSEAEPKARESANEAVKELVKAVSPDMEKVIDEKGLEEAEKLDPLTYDKISQAADTLSAMVYELEQNQGEAGLFSPNSRNQTHKVVSDFVKGREAYVKSLPLANQAWNGRAFATNAEFRRMSKAERGRHWTIDAGLAKAELIKEVSSSVNSEIEQSRKMLERYGAQPATKKSQRKSGGSAKTSNKPVSPESSATSSSSPNLTTGTEEVNTPQKELADMLWQS
tara:strand:+ start:11796 stop:13316 length:1521 start_codon:yes stop_codon:yes gene_type:complete